MTKAIEALWFLELLLLSMTFLPFIDIWSPRVVRFDGISIGPVSPRTLYYCEACAGPGHESAVAIREPALEASQ